MVFLVAGIIQAAETQIRLPALSPEGKILQQVGYTNFEIHYGRPSARGRIIMGGLVPFDRLWRTGGGVGTTISFDRDVTIAGKRVASGSYVLVTIPGEKEWTIMLNGDTSRLYVEEKDYDVADEAVRLRADVMRFPFFETLTIIPEIAGNSLHLILAWENTAIKFEIQTLTNEQIDHEVSSLTAETKDHESLGAAAYYFLRTGQHSERALNMINHALRLSKEPWYFETRMNLLAAKGQYGEARETLREAVEFLQETRPDYWQDHIASFRAQAATWAK
jgi:tetratricopeptide (TPR) repeat protein